MKKKLLFLVSFILSIPTLFANPIGAQEAELIARSYMNPSALRSGTTYHLVYQGENALRSASPAPYYIFNIEDKEGFIIISGDDELSPVVGYSSKCYFDVDNIPTAMKEWLNQYAQYVGTVQSDEKTVSTPPKTSVRGSVVVPPLVKSQWGQDAPYNGQCPTYQNKNLYTGCVATALAQIMRYHQWPISGTGSHSYQDPICGTISANFAQSQYDWANMLDTYKQEWRWDETQQTTTKVPLFNTTESNAVAKLMADIGVAVETNYNIGGSGASSNKALYGLYTHFKYSGTINLMEQVNYTLEEWRSAIQTELTNNRPFYYGGVSKSNTGHAFVCDGLDSNGLVHINWGWAGANDGYFNINYMNPDSPGIGGGEGGYNINQIIIVGIQPEDAQNIIPKLPQLSTLKGFYASNTPVERQKNFDCVLDQISNIGPGKFTGTAQIGLYKNGNYQQIVSSSPQNIELDEGYRYNLISLPVTIPASVPNGDYELRLLSKIKGEQEMQEILSPISKRRIPITVTSDQIIFDNTNLSVPVETTQAEVRLFPNPASNQINIEGYNHIVSVEIIDLTGKMIRTIQLPNEPKTTIEVSDLDKGCYVIKIYTLKDSIVKTFIKK